MDFGKISSMLKLSQNNFDSAQSDMPKLIEAICAEKKE